MTILFVGTTVSDFDYALTNLEQLEDEIAGLNGSRGSIQLDSSAGGMIAKEFDSVTTSTFWISIWHGGEKWDGLDPDWSLANGPEYSTISFWDGEGNPILYFGFNPNATLTNGYLQGRVYLRDGTTQDLTDIATPIGVESNVKYDIKIVPGSGFELHVNRSLVYSYTGNVGNSLSTVNGVGRFAIGQGDWWAYPTEFYNILAATFDTRYAEVQRILLDPTPTVDTSSASGTGNISQVVDEKDIGQYDLDTYKAFDAVGEKILFTENDTITLGAGQAVTAIVASYRSVQTGSSPVQTLTPTVNIASTDYTGTGISIGTTRRTYQHAFTTNPATAAGWEEADLNGVAYGLIANT